MNGQNWKNLNCLFLEQIYLKTKNDLKAAAFMSKVWFWLNYAAEYSATRERCCMQGLSGA